MSTAEELSTATEERPKKFYIIRMFTYIAVSVLYALVNFHKLCPTQVSKDMAKAYGVTTQKLEMFSAIYFYPYALTQPFAGLFADLFDPAKVLAIFGTIAAAGSLLCGFSQNLTIGIAGRVLTGLGCGPTYVSSLRIMTYWFKKQHLPVLLGILVAISCLGGILAATPLAYFSAKFGWRTAFYSIGGTGAVLSLLIGIFARGKPEYLGYDPVNEPPKEGDVKLTFKERVKDLFSNIRNVVAYPFFWVIVIFNVTFSCPYLNASAYWNGPFLTDVFNYSAVEIGNILIAHSVGLLVGSLVIPWISKFLRTKKWVMVFAGAFNTSIMALLYMMGNKFNKISLASVLFFFAFWSLTLTNIDYPLLTEYFGPTVSGSAVGIANFFLFIFVAIYQQISAAIIPLNGSQPTPSGVPKYEWAGYRNGLWLFGLVSCSVAFIFAVITKDDNSNCICKCKKQEEDHGPNLIDE